MLAFIDYFIGDNYRQDRDFFYKVRLLVGCILCFMMSMIIMAPFYNLFPDLPDYTLPVYLSICIPSTIFWMLLLKLLKQGRAYNFCSHATITNTTLSMYAGIAVTGGIQETDIHPLLMIPVLVSFLLLGKKGGILWSAIILLVYTLFILFSVYIHPFPNIVPVDIQKRLHIINWVHAFFSVAVLAVIYETFNQILMQERNDERKKFEYLATHDSLTGLANRHLFHERLESAIARCNRHKLELHLLMIDLNGFKEINDSLGHEAGDEILVHVSRQLEKGIRKNDMVARLGGDEFAVLLEGNITRADLSVLLDKLRTLLNTPCVSGHLQAELSVSGSIGIACCPDHAESSQALLRMADEAMYHAKNASLGAFVYDAAVLGDKQLIYKTNNSAADL